MPRCKSARPYQSVLAVALAVVIASQSFLAFGQEPYFVKDLDTRTPSNPVGLKALGARLFFNADDGKSGGELWTSNGTEEGTRPLREIWPQFHWSSLGTVVPAGDRFYFAATDDEHGTELWVSDGTGEGTRLLLDIWPGPDSGDPREIVVTGERLHFTADDGTSGRELWVSEGRDVDTRMVRDIWPGDASSYPSELVAVGNRLFFRAHGGESGYGIWVSDGTEVGTQLVIGSELIPPGHYVGKLVGVSDRLLFGMFEQGENGWALWRSDGTEAGTEVLREFPGAREGVGGPGFPQLQFIPLSNLIFFQFVVDIPGWWERELWVSDGTQDGTRKVGDIWPQIGWTSMGQVTPVGDRFFLVARDEQHGNELWVSDGTEAGTRVVRDIVPGSSGGGPRSLVAAGDRCFFTCDDGESGRELWVSDATEAGTRMVRDIWQAHGIPQWEQSEPGELTFIDDRLYFSADDGEHGRELWVSDGTEAGTEMLADINMNLETTPSGLWWTYWMRAIGGRVLIPASTGVWISDGTEAGTVPLRDGVPESGLWWWELAGSLEPYQGNFDQAGIGKIYFVLGRNTVDGAVAELWIADRSDTEPRLVREFSDIDLDWGKSLGDLLFFGARDARGQQDPTGVWVTDGTETGTHLVHAGPVGFSGSIPLEILGDGVFFVVNDREAWISDGTESGTLSLAEHLELPEDLSATTLTTKGNLLLISLDDGNGSELWVSDGTRAGTGLLRELVPESELWWWQISKYRVLHASGDRVIYYGGSCSEREAWIANRSESEPRFLTPQPVWAGLECSLFTSIYLTPAEDLFCFPVWENWDTFDFWVSDGTANKTRSLLDGSQIRLWLTDDEGGAVIGSPEYSPDLGLVFFAADGGQSGIELYALPLGPFPEASFTMTPARPRPGRLVTLDGRGSTPPEGTEITSYTWDLGDGTILEGPVVEHRYSPEVSGILTIGLTVTDSAGNSGTHHEFRIVAPAGWIRFFRGDCNDDGTVDISDAVFLLMFNFLGGEAPPCLAACDASADGDIDGTADPIYTLTYRFRGGPPPPAPYPECGPETLPAETALDCATPPANCP